MKRFLVIALVLITAVASGVSMAFADEQGPARARAAQAYRAHGEAVTPAPDGTIFCEAEEFKIEQPGWAAGYWGQNYYAATFANSFLSRQAFLGAPENCDETAASINVNVKVAGKYLVLVRYEAAYRFETQFKVKIEQGGQTKLDRLYGARKNLKIWAFGKKLKSEVAWSWGAVENVVWEGHDAYVNLVPGKAKITLIAGKQPAPQAKRNVDLVMLTRDEAQVKMRIDKEKYLPLDGMLTQAGDVYMKVANSGAAKVTVKSLGFPGGPMKQHSPYWIHIRNWKPIALTIEAGQTSGWIDVGGTMDTLNDGQWGFTTSGPCKLEFAVKDAAGHIEPARTFSANGALPLVSWADTRWSRKFQSQAQATQELFDYVKSLPVHGKKISLTRVNGKGGLPKAFYEFYGLNQAINGAGRSLDCRTLSLAQIQETYGDKMSAADRSKILIMSLGDEIGLPAPPAQTAKTGFVAFLKTQGLTPSQVDVAAGDDWSKVTYNANANLRTANPSIYYWSKRYRYHYGILAIKQRTDLLRKLLPNAHIGANFSPHHGGSVNSYLGEVFKWITCFREDGMTLPWSEDYAWQVPIGTTQMNGINLDMSRAGLRGKPDRKIMYYVMPHMPGNTPAMWRRLWHNAIGHGATILNLFEFDPVWVAYSENHVTGKDMYAAVLRGMRELGLYEDIIQTGTRQPAQVGLWFSETADIWGDNEKSFGSAKRALYAAILHQQVGLDFIVDQDAADGTLAKYKVLYLTDNHVSQASSKHIAQWVKNGGTLFATAGAGMFDEYNQPNSIMRGLYGVEQTALDAPANAQVGFLKEDLPFKNAIDTVTLKIDGKEYTLPALGIRSRITLKGADALGKFSDGSPALATRKVGKGQATYCAFLPGLAYFKPAIPLKPLDRGSTDDAMSHFIPTAFDVGASAVIGAAVQPLARPVVASEKLIDASVVVSKAGTAIILENWSGKPIPGMSLTINQPVPAKAELASGGKIETRKEGDATVFTFDMDVSGDVVILR
ncbi:MAG: beta-galactosidase trimerization domain-containing protein [Fuerstiella sp.]